jgi:hypothetical protein
MRIDYVTKPGTIFEKLPKEEAMVYSTIPISLIEASDK